jgi:hypothetical protein
MRPDESLFMMELKSRTSSKQGKRYRKKVLEESERLSKYIVNLSGLSDSERAVVESRLEQLRFEKERFVDDFLS